MPQKRYLLFSVIIVGAMTAYGNFLSTPQTHRSVQLHYFQTYTRQNGGIWNSMIDNEAYKWRYSWKGSEKSGNECSVDIPRTPGQTTNRLTAGDNTNPWTPGSRFGGGRDQGYFITEETQSVPEPPLHVLIAISLLWIPFNRWKRKGDHEDKDK